MWETDLLSEHDIILHQLPGQPHAVLDVHVVVLGAVHQHEPAVRDVVRHLEETGEDVAPGVVLLGRQSEVPLSVGRVVVEPLGDGRHRDPAGDLLRLLQSHLGHHEAGDVTSVAPAPDANPLAVDEPELLPQLADHVQRVLGLPPPQLLVHAVLEVVPLEACPAHVDVGGDEVPLAGQEGLPGDGPLLVDSLSAGPGVAKQQTSSTSSQQEVLSLFFFLQTLANLVLSMNSTSAN